MIVFTLTLSYSSIGIIQKAINLYKEENNKIENV